MSKVVIPHLLSVRDWGVNPSQGYPFDLPWAQGLSLDFTTRVTFFVGENGSGKSTLLDVDFQTDVASADRIVVV